MASSTLFKTILATVFVCLIVQVDSKIRRRRQNGYNNYGAYGLQPAVADYYGISGGGSYTGNNRLQNTLIAGEKVHLYPTPVNVMSGGSYNPAQYDTYPGRAKEYYSNFNDMRLPSSHTWNSNVHSPSRSYPSLLVYNTAQCHIGSSLIIKLLFILLARIISVRML